MKIKIANLTEENLIDAPEWDSHPFSCKYCIYWEFPEECIDPAKEKKEDMLEKKLSWLQNTSKIFGNCGKIVYVDGILLLMPNMPLLNFSQTRRVTHHYQVMMRY